MRTFDSDLSGKSVSPYIDADLYCVSWRMYYEPTDDPRKPYVQEFNTFVLAHDMSAAIETARDDIAVSVEYEPGNNGITEIVSVVLMGDSVLLTKSVVREALSGVLLMGVQGG